MVFFFCHYRLSICPFKETLSTVNYAARHNMTQSQTDSDHSVIYLEISSKNITILPNKMPASVAQLDAPSDWRPGGRGFNPRRGRQHSFVEIDHEIFSTVILSLPLIQEGQLSVSGERMCTILVNRLED